MFKVVTVKDGNLETKEFNSKEHAFAYARTKSNYVNFVYEDGELILNLERQENGTRRNAKS